ncbi:glycerol kinase GlpK [Eisenibacter elegans]|jgi:glycerol kinase|uniref:glycerol kinase GlpK n=1 Tax=Eisenibacter elegans TaxID=997 RepID=UPI0003FFD547|nr:glycerol kinase GlpK [Eisenibacter elegans]
MQEPTCIIALDQGTTSARALAFDKQGRLLGIAQRTFTQYFPAANCVEHDALEIWDTQWAVFQQLIRQLGVAPSQIAALGITNQRETTLLWDKKTGEPLHRALVWQDKRTAEHCERLKAQGLNPYIREKTGLVLDAYFSATKLAWLLDNIPNARSRAERGELCFGTIDTWLLWKLTKGAIHATDYTNASRTMLFDIHQLQWDAQLLEIFQIPPEVLPQVYTSMHHFGDLAYDGSNIPITGIAGDQQAALFGQGCWEAGTAKNTYGTGCFMLMHTGEQAVRSTQGLITTLACSTGAKPQYALEGSIFIAGAAIQWLRDGLHLIDEAADSAYFAHKAPEDHGVYVVPAFAGLGAPYWDSYAKGAIFGLGRETGKEVLIRATLESLAYQTKDVLLAMEIDAHTPLQMLRVDGGACANDLLMQFQADLLNTPVERPAMIESTAAGAAYLAGLQVGFWNLAQLRQNRDIDRIFSPKMSEATRHQRYQGWQEAIRRTMGWASKR